MIGKELDEIAEGLLRFFPIINILFKRARNGAPPIPAKGQAYHILGMLKAAGPLPISTVGKRLGIVKQNMTSIVDRLIEDSLVIRKADAKDRRIVNIEVTEKGVEALQEGKRNAKEALGRSLSELDGEDIHTLHTAFAMITDVFDRIEKGGRYA
jgi:DNA-binding MarR family transcriptional regulator